MKIKVGGYFTVYKGKPGQEKQIGHFHNHVTDYGLNALVSKTLTDLTTTLHVGSGMTAPADSDTALVNEIASTTTLIINTTTYDNSAAYIGVRKKFSFAAGVATGTLYELGLSDGSYLFNRQLFQDYLGNPTSITVEVDESLLILCEIRLICAAVNTPIEFSPITINGQSYDYICNLQPNFFNFTWWNLQPFEDFINQSRPTVCNSVVDYSSGATGYSGTAVICSASSVSSYIVDSFELECDYIWYAGTLDQVVNLLALRDNFGRYFIELGLIPGYNMYINTPWQASTGYTLGKRIISAVGDNFIYQAIAAGTSDASAPTWPTTIGDTVTDGTVTWECVAPVLNISSSDQFNLTVKLSWGRE